ncbi:hypothetical protein ACFE04_022243 [Oxalis oulophora]
MSEDIEYRCFVGGLAWATSDRGLRDAFDKFGHLLEAKIVLDKESGRSRGFGFVTFDQEKAMEDAIAAMNGMDLDGRQITVDKAQPQQSSGRGYDGGRDRDRGGRDRDSDRGHDRDRGRSSYGGGGGGKGGGGGGDCFKCGKPGHFARECPSGEGARGGGGRFGGGGGGGGGGGREDRYGGGGGGSGRYGPDRNGDRNGGGRSRDSGSRGGGGGSDRYGRDRSGPYERRPGGGGRSSG